MVRGLGHAAFGVADLNKSLEFYCGQLGLREAFRLYRDEAPDKPWIVYLQVCEEDFIELFPDPGVAAPGGRQNYRAPVSYRHLCLLVDDMAATLADLKAKGVAIDRGPQVGKDHNTQAWITDPDGNPIELMQISVESPQAKADAAWRQSRN